MYFLDIDIIQPDTAGEAVLSEFEQVGGGEQTGVILCVFGCEYSTEGKSLTRMGVVGDCDAVGRAVIYHRMYARNLVAAQAFDGKQRRIYVV